MFYWYCNIQQLFFVNNGTARGLRTHNDDKDGSQATWHDGHGGIPHNFLSSTYPTNDSLFPYPSSQKPFLPPSRLTPSSKIFE